MVLILEGNVIVLESLITSVSNRPNSGGREGGSSVKTGNRMARRFGSRNDLFWSTFLIFDNICMNFY